MAAVFLFLHALTLTFANTIRVSTIVDGLRWGHWIGFMAWAVGSYPLLRISQARSNRTTQFIFPLAAFLAGLGILTIWRLNSDFGMRQAMLYVAICTLVTILLEFEQQLRKLKWVFPAVFVGSLSFTALTIVFGVNPAGTGSTLWLGCCGVYFQPSEFLKLAFVIFLAYGLGWNETAPKKTRLMIGLGGLAILLVVAQKDLGTSLLFVVLFVTMLAIKFDDRRFLLAGASMFIITLPAAYQWVGWARQRIETWLNPWGDPSGTSYQIIQSFLAIANGGVNGRGAGMGYPTLIPVAHSDFVFSAIAEELGLVGTLLIIATFAVLVFIGFNIASRAESPIARLLASGLSIYLGAQTLVIIGGNLGIIPLTGVTLPFLSYGGSSLLISYLAVAAIFAIGNHAPEVAAIPVVKTQKMVFTALMVGLCACALGAGWWVVAQGPQILQQTINPRRSINELYSQRGPILDRSNNPLVETNGEAGAFIRVINNPSLSPILGYNSANFGQTNIERSFDETLRGERGYPDLQLWWSHVLFGWPPPGLAIRTTIDPAMQSTLSAYFEGKQGAGLVINAETGEIFAAVSGPYLNNNELAENAIDPAIENGPLINRISMGEYRPNLVKNMAGELKNFDPNSQQLETLDWLSSKGFYLDPDLGFDRIVAWTENKFSPLMAAKFFASVSNNGICPALQFVSGIKTPQQGWVSLPKSDAEMECITPAMAMAYAEKRATPTRSFWTATGYDTRTNTTMYIAGTMPEWNGIPLVFVIFDEAHYSGKMKNDLDALFTRFMFPK